MDCSLQGLPAASAAHHWSPASIPACIHSSQQRSRRRAGHHASLNVGPASQACNAWPVHACSHPHLHGPHQPARSSLRSRASLAVSHESSSTQYSDVLDMEYMRKVYQATQPPEGTSHGTISEAINARVAHAVLSSTKLSEVVQLIKDEEPQLSARTTAAALATLSFTLNPSYPKSKLQHHSSASQSAQEQLLQEWRAEAPPLVRSLCINMASKVSTGDTHLTVSQVVTAVLCVGRVLGHARTVDAELSTAIQTLLQHVRSDLFVCTPTELSRLAQGLGYISIAMDQAWLSSFAKVAQSKMMVMSGSQMCMVAWALAQQGHNPGAYWQASLKAAIQPLLTDLKPESLTNVLWALRKWGYDPGAEWMETAWGALEAAIPRMPTNCLAACLNLVSRLGPKPSPVLLEGLFNRLMQHCHQLTPSQDCQVLASLVQLHYLPAEDQLLRFVQGTESRLGQYNPRQLITLGWSMSHIGFLPTRPWVQTWAAAACKGIRSMSPLDVTILLYAFRVWHIPPPRQLVQDVLQAVQVQARAGSLPVSCAAKHLSTLADLKIAPPRQLLRELLVVLGSEARLLEEEQQHTAGNGPSSAEHPAEGSHAGSAKTGLALCVAVTCLPRLLALYDKRQLVQHSAQAAVVVPGAASTATATPAASEVVSSSSTATSQYYTRPVRRPAASSEANEAEVTIPRHASADVVELLVPSSLALPVLRALGIRLQSLNIGRLVALMDALALMRLSPGADFLKAHIRAVTPHLAILPADKKLRLDAAYHVLTTDASCLMLDVRLS